MPSPFPGMDPYLEDPALWPDLHDALAGEIRAILNGKLPESYYAQLGVREEIGIIGEGTIRRIIPDVTVNQTPVSVRPGDDDAGGGMAVLVAEPRTELDPAYEVAIPSDPIEVPYIEIIDSRTGHEVVTVIEILSPSNKQAGEDRDRYLQKRKEILQSKTTLIEIDLLRSGDRPWLDAGAKAVLARQEPPAEYVVVVDRAWRREPQYCLKVIPASLKRPLPVIAVPLREGEPECTLDLQYAFQQTYDRGPYRRGAVDYSQPPTIPLDDALQGWATEVLVQWKKAEEVSR